MIRLGSIGAKFVLLTSFALLTFCGAALRAQDFASARETFYQGDYDQCIELTREQVDKGIWNDFWSRQLMRALLERGKYEEARDCYVEVAKKFSSSIDLRVLGATAHRYCGETQIGNELLDEIPSLVTNAPWRYSDRENLLAVGKYLLTEGEDARYILESCFDRILKTDPAYVDAHVAIAELALNKADYQEAVKSLDRALELRPNDPKISYLLARAWDGSDREKSTTYLKAALDLNPKHTPSLLMTATRMIDGERYDAAEQVLEEVLKVNETTPEAWALKAAIAHLRGKYQQEGEFRSRGLARWNVNPQVDYLAGKVLSRHYRFEEGVTYQQRALKLDPDFLPARFQLAQDLLRTGRDPEGWEMVQQVATTDKYNVVAFNLRKLSERLNRFTTIESPDFIIRMDAEEAKIYGSRVLELLQEAKATVCEKYDFELKQPTTVEIFPQQSDFAIRTFGLPGGAGYLGVCFGSLITANSPASQGENPSNWESVLWHEFCHVVTLQKTNNRMPRWLSEGISVYEEVECDPTWGERMTPQYRQMLMGEDFVPLSELSSAFLNPKSPIHLQFAYFESSLAVRYLVERHGMPLLLKSLEDLGMGVSIEDAFSRRFGDADRLDADFKEYVDALTADFYPETDFSSEGVPMQASLEELQDWVQEHPRSYLGLSLVVQGLITKGALDEALAVAEKLDGLYADDTSDRGALRLKARIAEEREDSKEEQRLLEDLMQRSSDNVPVLLRLLELCAAAEDWVPLQRHALNLLAVNPLLPEGHEGLILASRKLGRPEQAIVSLRALQEMDPLDPAGLYYQLAEAQFAASTTEFDLTTDARRNALLALEQSPRYREAQKLLQQLVDIRSGKAKLPSDPWGEEASEKISEPAEAGDEPGPAAKLMLDVQMPDAGEPPSPRKDARSR